eukprot:CAMPEP_0179345544 /NCGR_PEP_ID=MMETSP0797-20121207/72099_1 /TAXON_ID=47934 /ORGANISM="Dinophysis acuminata, Strain DAEP01" /LENGTH=100 /DNA_ID=CAMNT_0021060037 /DNA_START=56 /DNA_END=359 /DNA_ORIENTATION=+
MAVRSEPPPPSPDQRQESAWSVPYGPKKAGARRPSRREARRASGERPAPGAPAGAVVQDPTIREATAADPGAALAGGGPDVDAAATAQVLPGPTVAHAEN